MTPAQAQQIIQTLADGIDPASGEVLPDDSPVSSPQVIRALFLAAQALQAMAGKTGKAKAARAASGLPGQAGKPWSQEEDQRLLAAFDAGTPQAELAQIHERTTGAIHSRLVRLGRLQVDAGTSG